MRWLPFGAVALLALAATILQSSQGLQIAGLAGLEAIVSEVAIVFMGPRVHPVVQGAVTVGIRVFVLFGGGMVLVLREVAGQPLWQAFPSSIVWLLAAYMMMLVTRIVVLARSRGKKG